MLQSQLDIPFKVRAGHIGEIIGGSCSYLPPFHECKRAFSHLVLLLKGRLELKIPWKNLYTQSVEATLDGVYLLIVPTASKINIHVQLHTCVLTVNNMMCTGLLIHTPFQ